MREQHPRAFKVTVGWTLVLLWLGSVVHATGSSLACPDWPTCFGTMAPEMSGGVFWEHLHRLVAGGLVLMFLLATWLARREVPGRPEVVPLCYAGLGLLVVQSVFGGITVIYRLPDLVSTTHLGLAFLFLALATYLASVTDAQARPTASHATLDRMRAAAWGATALVFAQSVLGALVRHTDAGMACVDFPLCLGRVVPPLVNLQITAHFVHRALALVVAIAVIALALWARRIGAPVVARRWLDLAAALVLIQVGLGVASVLTRLAVVPVSMHTVVAAALVSILTHAGTLAHTARPSAEPEPANALAAA